MELGDFPKNLKPGEFMGGEETDEKFEYSKEKIELKPQVSENLVKDFELFKEAFHPKADSIYYPCCGQDVSISKAFPESDIVFLDMNHSVVEALRKEKHSAVEAPVEEYQLEKKADILLLLNPQVAPSKEIIDNLRDAGYVLCNNYHSTATFFKNEKDFKISGVIGMRGKSEPFLDTEKLSEYWEEIETDEELKRAPFSWGGTNYKNVRDVVLGMTGKEENLVEEYKKIREQAKKDEEGSDGNPMVKDRNGEVHILADLPKKKGTADDIFVFQKIN